MIKEIKKMFGGMECLIIMFAILTFLNSTVIGFVSAIVYCSIVVVIMDKDVKQKRKGALISYAVFCLMNFDPYEAVWIFVLGVAGFLYYEKKKTDKSLEYETGLDSLDTWYEYNHFMPFGIEKYSYVCGEQFSISKGLLIKDDLHFHVNNYIIREKRSLLQMVCGLSTVYFVSIYGGIEGCNNRIEVKNIRHSSFCRLLHMIKEKDIRGGF